MDCYIAGLDPGSTVGIALLDLDGNLVHVDSFKGDLYEAIKRATQFGKILVVGTDVCKVPRFVEKFAIKVGARIVVPDYDLLFHEKRKKTKEFLKNLDIKLKDKHQMDALAAALIAFRQYNGLFSKIDSKVGVNMSRKIRELVLVEDIPIRKALGLVK